MLVEIKVSVIVPVYNVESYIGRCVDSLILQSLKEVEIILVDDGSTDFSGIICDKYASVDSRITVIHQKNCGLSGARNIGMSVATGKYIMFVDADDWCEIDYCKLPFDVAENNNADLVIFEHTGERTRNTEAKQNVNETDLSRDQAICFVYKNHKGMVWNKLYRKDLVSNIHFIPGRYYEDGPYTAELLQNTNRVIYVDKVLYHVSNRKNSITHLGKAAISNDFFEMTLLTANLLEDGGFIREANWILIENSWIYLLKYGDNTAFAKKCKYNLVHLNEYPEPLSWKRKLLIAILRVSPIIFDIMIFFKGTRIRITDRVH